MNTTQMHRNRMTARLSSLLDDILNRVEPRKAGERQSVREKPGTCQQALVRIISTAWIVA